MSDLIKPAYDVFDLGYSRDLLKTDDFYNETPAMGSVFSDSVSPVLMGSGESVGNTTIKDGYLQSSNFVTGTTGWQLTPTSAEINVSTAILSLDIPDATTADSFHVDSSGNTHWGCNVADFATDPTNADAYILNTGALYCSSATITGATITTPTITGIQTGSEIAIQGWTHDLVFSVTDADTVAWASGTITLMNGDTYAIDAGNTGNMAAETFVYLDIATSITVLQVTTTKATTVGTGKIMVAVCENATDEAEFVVFGSSDANYDGGKIRANSVTANEILANTITATEIAASTITATQMNVATLSAISANIGTITAGTITGAVLQTSASANTGIKMSSALAAIHVYGGNIKFFAPGSASQSGYIGVPGGTALNLSNTAGDIGLFANTWLTLSGVSGVLCANNLRLDSNIHLIPIGDNQSDLGSSSYEFKNLYIDGTAYIDTISGVGACNTHLIPTDNQYDLGSSVSEWRNLYVDGTAHIDTLDVDAGVESNLLPFLDGTYSLGSAAKEWNNLYIDGTAQVDALRIDQTPTAETPGATHTATINMNGTNYKFLCLAA